MISRKITLACALTLLAACGSADSRNGGGAEGGGAGNEGGKGGGKAGGTGGSKSGGTGGSKSTGGSGGTSKSGGSGGSTATGGTAATGGTGGTVATGGTGGSTATGGTGGTAATGGTGGTVAAKTRVDWDFEQGITPWRNVLGSADVLTLPQPTASTAQAKDGTSSLAVAIDAPAAEQQVFVGIQAEPFILMGAQKNIKKVTGYVWVPLDHKIAYTQMFTFSFGSTAVNEWQGVPPTGGLVPGDWSKFEMDLTTKFPAGYPLDNLLAVGFQFNSTVAWKGTLYIDGVGVELMP
ncbi:MAG: hypothetical protein SGI86_22285 [Deltaproteobacteria bacterium]|nr:hypothetical protein [Deltaproteobacteria bacterium]